MHNASQNGVKVLQWMNVLNGIDLVTNEHLLMLFMYCQVSAEFSNYVWRWSGTTFIDVFLERQ